MSRVTEFTVVPYEKFTVIRYRERRFLRHHRVGLFDGQVGLFEALSRFLRESDFLDLVVFFRCHDVTRDMSRCHA